MIDDIIIIVNVARRLTSRCGRSHIYNYTRRCNDKLQSFIIVIVTHYNQQLKHYYSTYNEKRKGCANDIVFHSKYYKMYYSILF